MGFTSRSQLSRRQAQPTASHMAGDDLERPSYQSKSYQTGLPLWCQFAKKAQLDKDMGSNNLEHQKKTLLPKLWDYFKSLIYLYHIELGGNKKLMSCVLVRGECGVWTNHNVEMMQWLECRLWVQILDSAPWLWHLEQVTNFSMLQFPHLCNGDNNNAHFRVVCEGLDFCLAHGRSLHVIIL